MSFNEVFPNPTVKQVIFQVRYPNLFGVGSRIGEFQLRVMDRFPESSLKLQKKFIVGNIMSDLEPPKLEDDADSPDVRHIWQFESPHGVTLNVTTNSLDLSSTSHKTYKNEAVEHTFREAIDFAVQAFLEVYRVPVFKTVGLRYIDECPIRQLDAADFKQCFNSSLPIDRFPIDSAKEMSFSAKMHRENGVLRYKEVLHPDDKPYLELDFDGVEFGVDADEFLEATDRIHEMVGNEFEATVKDPIVGYMRGEWE